MSVLKPDKIYFDRKNREKGKSRWTLAKKLRLVMDTLISFSNAPIKFMIIVGALFDIFALAIFISVLYEYFTVGIPIAGWASLMSVVLFAAGLILAMLGILGEYLWRVLDAARNRPVFIIDEHFEMKKDKQN